MRAKPTKQRGAVVLEINPRDESLLAAGTTAAVASVFRLKKILVPIDFSECSRQALRYALPLAKEHQAALTLLYVVPRAYAYGEYSTLNYTSLEADLRASGEKELAKLAAQEIHGEVPAATLVQSGAPAPAILEAARKLPADLIVISTHGRTGLKHVLMGSVAEHVVRRAPCPVLVVRGEETESGAT